MDRSYQTATDAKAYAGAVTNIDETAMVAFTRRLREIRDTANANANRTTGLIERFRGGSPVKGDSRNPSSPKAVMDGHIATLDDILSDIATAVNHQSAAIDELDRIA